MNGLQFGRHSELAANDARPGPLRGTLTGSRALAARTYLGDRRARMVGLTPVTGLRLLNFMGAMCGPVTMKSPLTTRMVSVVIAPPYPNDRTKAEARDRAFRLRRTR